MQIKQFEIWIANLNPRFGTEAGKVRPVVIIQTNLLNTIHPSIIICPITTNVQPDVNILRVHLKKGMAKLDEDCNILVDQIRAIDKNRLQIKLGMLSRDVRIILQENIAIILDLH